MSTFTVKNPRSTITIILSILVGQTIDDSRLVDVQIEKACVRVHLTPAAFRILYILAAAAFEDRKNPNILPEYWSYRSTKVLAEFYAVIRKHRYELDEPVVRDHIRQIRRKVKQALGILASAGVACDPEMRFIENDRGLGYRINPAVTVRVIDANDPDAPEPSRH